MNMIVPKKRTSSSRGSLSGSMLVFGSVDVSEKWALVLGPPAGLKQKSPSLWWFGLGFFFHQRNFYVDTMYRADLDLAIIQGVEATTNKYALES